MSAASAWDRFEELDAGRIMGDLSSQEISEWQILAADQVNNSTAELELIATELELKHTQPCDLTSTLSNKLLSTIPAFSNKARTVEQSSDKNISILPWLGWAVAACLVVVFNIPKTKELPVTPLTIAQKYEALISDVSNTQRLAFAHASDPYSNISGEVIWNDVRQEGYMSLVNLPVNDPSQNQYQLWIVDPERDELPVDGGVFDIPSGSATAVIPIRNALQVSKPVAFLITLEQPGGVVKSKQEVVVALAKS
jgi:anti-sigma-K factor RskA